MGSVGLILAHVAGVLPDILERESDLPLPKKAATRRKEEAEEATIAKIAGIAKKSKLQIR